MEWFNTCKPVRTCSNQSFLTFQIDKLQINSGELKNKIAEFERLNRHSENVIGDLRTEIEHLKCEVTEARGQYKECAQEVN